MSTDQNAEWFEYARFPPPIFLNVSKNAARQRLKKSDNDNFPAKVKQEVNSPFQHVCGRLPLVLCAIPTRQRLNEETPPSRG